MKQNSCQHVGIKLFRFSTEDLMFEGRFEDDIISYFGRPADDFIDEGIVVDRQVGLYEHQEGALDEMAARRKQGVRCFLAVLPTASGKSRIVEEDLARFALGRTGFKALIAAPSKAIVADWKNRLAISLSEFASDVLVCTYCNNRPGRLLQSMHALTHALRGPHRFLCLYKAYFKSPESEQRWITLSEH